MHPALEKKLTAKKDVLSSFEEKPASKDKTRDFETPILSIEKLGF